MDHGVGVSRLHRHREYLAESRESVSCVRNIIIHCLVLLQLTTNYGQSGSLGEQATLMLNKFDWYFIPMMNPDGYNFTKVNVILHVLNKSRIVS